MTCTTEDCFPSNDVEESWTSDGIARGLGFAYDVGDTYELFIRCYLTTDAKVRIAELTGSATDEPFDPSTLWDDVHSSNLDFRDAMCFLFTKPMWLDQFSL